MSNECPSCEWLRVGYLGASARADNAVGRCDAALRVLREAVDHLKTLPFGADELVARAEGVLSPENRSQWAEEIADLRELVKFGRQIAKEVDHWQPAQEFLARTEHLA